MLKYKHKYDILLVKIKNEEWMKMPNVTCSNCGTEFDSKEKKCPSCGTKNSLKICPICGGQMAKSAKRCPKCGAKNKKPIYKRWWFWLIIIYILFRIPWFSSDKNTKGEDVNNNVKSEVVEPTVSSSSSSTNSMSDISASKDDIVGTWLLYAEIRNDDNSKMILDDNNGQGFSFYSDGSGEMFDLEEDSQTPVMWSSSITNGHKIYQITGKTGGKLLALITPEDYHIQELKNMLTVDGEESLVFFKKEK